MQPTVIRTSPEKLHKVISDKTLLLSFFLHPTPIPPLQSTHSIFPPRRARVVKISGVAVTKKQPIDVCPLPPIHINLIF
jgi:hypothetical protein